MQTFQKGIVMPSFFLTPAVFSSFKRASRAQLPEVRHTHVLEALARAFGFNTLAALQSQLSDGPHGTGFAAELSVDAMRSRLVELGYQDALSLDIDFSTINQSGLEEQRSLVNRSRFPQTLEDIKATGAITAIQHKHLAALLDRRSTIVVAGHTGSGRSTMAHALVNEMARRFPDKRFGFFQQTLESPYFPNNVNQFILDIEAGARRYVTQDGSPVTSKDYDVFVIDALRDSADARLALRSWSNAGLGIATLNAAPDKSIERIAALASEDQLDGSQVTAMGSRVRSIVNAVVHMENRNGQPRAGKIEAGRAS
jgi:hypothetical protein